MTDLMKWRETMIDMESIKDNIKKYPVQTALFLLLGLLCVTETYHVYKPLPKDISFNGKAHPAQNVQFLFDLTYTDHSGSRHVEQQIFDEVFNIIKNARKFILIDMFLYNEFMGAVKENIRPLTKELSNVLIAQKQNYPQMEIIVITDPINTVYGGLQSKHLQQLREAGIRVTLTNLERLRDSNPIYSSFWRIFFQIFGNSEGGLFPNPFDTGKVSLRSYLRLINFKANHRKLLIADGSEGFVGLVTSANPHDGSSAHSNVALKFTGPATHDLLTSEKAVLSFSDGPQPLIDLPESSEKTDMTIQVVTEKKIKKAVLKAVDQAGQGDSIDMVMFYLADRDVISAIKKARQRGVGIRIVLDPNKDAFGRPKNGIPNRQTARELHLKEIPIRWFDTHGEQCHVKMILVTYQEGKSSLILGSANFTKRNLNNLNLETDVVVCGNTGSDVFSDVRRFFTRIWENSGNHIYSVEYCNYEDNSFFNLIAYRWMELTGTCTF